MKIQGQRDWGNNFKTNWRTSRGFSEADNREASVVLCIFACFSKGRAEKWEHQKNTFREITEETPTEKEMSVPIVHTGQKAALSAGKNAFWDLCCYWAAKDRIRSSWGRERAPGQPKAVPMKQQAMCRKEVACSECSASTKEWSFLLKEVRERWTCLEGTLDGGRLCVCVCVSLTYNCVYF